MRWIIALSALVVPMLTANAQDLTDGERQFKRCLSCHTDTDEHAMGPSLATLVGRKAGSIEGYQFSPAISTAGASGIVWDTQTLDQYLQNPRGFYGASHRCVAPPIRRAEARENLIAYLTNMPQIALANRLEREAEEANRRRVEKLRAEKEALETYQAQLAKAAEAIQMGAGPGSLATDGYLRPGLLKNVYEGRFSAAAETEFPAEYLYRFAEVTDKQCDSPLLRQALTSYGGNLLELGFDPAFQEDVLSQALEALQQMAQNPGGALAAAARKEAAMKAGIEDAVRFAVRHQCEADTGIARRMTHNIAAILAGTNPVYVDDPVEPIFADNTDEK